MQWGPSGPPRTLAWDFLNKAVGRRDARGSQVLLAPHFGGLCPGMKQDPGPRCLRQSSSLVEAPALQI